MNTEPIVFDPEDPRLTAYALGELPDPAERAAVEDMLARSPEARAALHEIRALTATLVAEYDHERGTAAPSNVIAMKPAARSANWPRRLLLAAALLVLTASVARLMIPYRELPRLAQSRPPQPAPPGVLLKSMVPGSVQPSATPDQSLNGLLAVQPLPVLPAMPAEEPRFEKKADDLSRLSAADSPPVLGKQVQELALPADAQTRVAAAAPASVLPRGEGGKNERSEALTFYGGSTVGKARKSVDPLVASGANGGAVSAKEAAKPLLAMRDRAKSADFDDVAGGVVYDGGVVSPTPVMPRHQEAFNTALYEHRPENAFLSAKDSPLSTFSIDVDTASYANVRRFIESGSLPPPDAVRIEEMVNYFPYNYAPPAPGDEQHPFAVHLEAASCPWNPQDRLVRIGIKGREMARDKRPASNLVFLLDVSGSMEPPERLPLVKAAMRLLVENLTAEDRVAIVTYAGESGLVLPPTTGDKTETILRALENLHAGGSTNGASGIRLAYQVARDGFIKGGTNRVILATDGDFNVGVTSQGDLVRTIEREAKSGVALSALGVGTDNFKDATMQKLADKGNGNYHYIDKLDEARKVLVEQMSGTLVTIAKDVKIQVEFNPATVAAYRLIGYEKRMLKKEDFNDDRVDAGEIGAGHCVTALYEVVPAGLPVPQTPPAVDALKYAGMPAPAAAVVTGPVSIVTPSTGELLTVKMRHKAPDGDKSERSYEESLTDHGAPGDFSRASADFRFAAAVASFGMALQGSTQQNGATFGAALELAQGSASPDPGEYRAGFIELVRKARAIQGERGE